MKRLEEILDNQVTIFDQVQYESNLLQKTNQSLKKQLKLLKEQAQKFELIQEFNSQLYDEMQREKEKNIEAEERIKWYEEELRARDGMTLVQALHISQSQHQSSFESTPTERLAYQLVGLAENSGNDREFAWKKEVEFEETPKHRTSQKDKKPALLKKRSMFPGPTGPSSPLSH